MTKLLLQEINYCEDCPFSFNDGDTWCNKTGRKASAVGIPEVDCPLPDINSPSDLDELSDKLDNKISKIVLEYMMRIACRKFEEDPYELFIMLDESGEFEYMDLEMKELKKTVRKIALDLGIL